MVLQCWRYPHLFTTMIGRALAFLLMCLPAAAATYYVSPSGNDGNNGLGPDASHGTNRPKLTPANVLATVSAGDTIYFAPGKYPCTETLADNNILIYADPQNEQGFKDGSGNTLAKGLVILTGYESGDSSAGTGAPVITANGIDGWTLRGFYIHGTPKNACITMTDLASTGVTIEQCAIIGNGAGGYGINLLVPAGTDMDLTVRRCIIRASGNSAANCISTIHQQHSANWDADVRIENCVMENQNYNTVGFLQSGGSGSGKMGGWEMVGCSLYGSYILRFQGGFSTSVPFLARNCYMECGDYAVVVQTSNGEVDVDYCAINGGHGHSYNLDAGTSNFALGANNKYFTTAARLDHGAARLAGFGARPEYSITSESPLRGAGAPGYVLSVDLFGRARPSPNSIGGVEYFATDPIGGLTVGTIVVGTP